MSRHGSSPRNEGFESWTRRVSTTSLSGGPASLNSVIRRRALCPAAVVPGTPGSGVPRRNGKQGSRHPRVIPQLCACWRWAWRKKSDPLVTGALKDRKTRMRGWLANRVTRGVGCKPAWFISWKYAVAPMTRRIRAKGWRGVDYLPLENREEESGETGIYPWFLYSKLEITACIYQFGRGVGRRGLLNIKLHVCSDMLSVKQYWNKLPKRFRTPQRDVQSASPKPFA